MNGVKTEPDLNLVISEENDDNVQLNEPAFNDLMQQLESYTPTVRFRSMAEMAWAATRIANEPFTGLIICPLSAKHFLSCMTFKF